MSDFAASSSESGRTHGRPWLFAGVLLFLAVTAGYLAAVVLLRIDHIFLPGNEIGLPRALKVVPGFSSPADPLAGATLPANRINILVLGLDRRPSEGSEPTRTDSMFVVTLDPATKTAGVLSIPRDLWVPIPDGQGGVFHDRINTAYRYGGRNPYKGGSMQAVRDTMAQNFPQIRIDYQIAVDFASFIRIIDTLGGIDVDVTEAFHYDEAVSVDGGVEDFPAYDIGIEHMNGQRALYYSRYRGGIDGDLGRIRRQQQVMLAVAQHVVALDAFGRAPDLWARFKDAVDTDVPAFRVPGIALLTKQIGLDRIVMRSLGEVTREVITDGGADVLVATPTDMARVVAGVFADPRLRQEAAVIEVQNAAGRNGLATATATYLSQKGLAAADISVTTATQGMAEETVVYNLHGKDFTTRQIADWLGLPSSRVRFLNDPAVAPLTRHADVLIVLGRDARAPQLPSIPDSSGNLSPAPRTLQGALPSGN